MTLELEPIGYVRAVRPHAEDELPRLHQRTTSWLGPFSLLQGSSRSRGRSG